MNYWRTLTSLLFFKPYNPLTLAYLLLLQSNFKEYDVSLMGVYIGTNSNQHCRHLLQGESRIYNIVSIVSSKQESELLLAWELY